MLPLYSQESHPSAVSAPLRTLGAAEEIVRLAAHNNALIVENLRIPVLEAQIGDLEEAREAQVSVYPCARGTYRRPEEAREAQVSVYSVVNVTETEKGLEKARAGGAGECVSHSTSVLKEATSAVIVC